MTDSYLDVIIVGGSYSGLSAAMTLGRSLRKTLVIDSGKPCNRFTPHSHNFITQDGKKPNEIAAIARLQVEEYKTVEFLNGQVANAERIERGFKVATESGKTFYADKLIFATGIKDTVPDIEGFAACWGISIIHCPYCHGYEYRNQTTGILVNGENTFHFAPLIYNLTKNVTVLTNGKVQYTPDEMARLHKNQISIVEAEIHSVEHHNGMLNNVVFTDGTKLHLDALYTALPFEQQSNVPEMLGCQFTDKGYISVDGFFKTTVDGVYACGDNSSLFRSVSNAVASGNFAAAAINKELAMERF